MNIFNRKFIIVGLIGLAMLGALLSWTYENEPCSFGRQPRPEQIESQGYATVMAPTILVGGERWRAVPTVCITNGELTVNAMVATEGVRLLTQPPPTAQSVSAVAASSSVVVDLLCGSLPLLLIGLLLLALVVGNRPLLSPVERAALAEEVAAEYRKRREAGENGTEP